MTSMTAGAPSTSCCRVCWAAGPAVAWMCVGFGVCWAAGPAVAWSRASRWAVGWAWGGRTGGSHKLLRWAGAGLRLLLRPRQGREMHAGAMCDGHSSPPALCVMPCFLPADAISLIKDMQYKASRPPASHVASACCLPLAAPPLACYALRLPAALGCLAAALSTSESCLGIRQTCPPHCTTRRPAAPSHTAPHSPCHPRLPSIPYPLSMQLTLTGGGQQFIDQQVQQPLAAAGTMGTVSSGSQQGGGPRLTGSGGRATSAGGGGGPLDPELPHAPPEAEGAVVRQEVVVEENESCLYVRVHAHDRHGLLADIVRALKALPLEITTAAVTTTRDGGVYDVFQVRLPPAYTPRGAGAGFAGAKRLPRRLAPKGGG